MVHLNWCLKLDVSIRMPVSRNQTDYLQGLYQKHQKHQKHQDHISVPQGSQMKSYVSTAWQNHCLIPLSLFIAAVERPQRE